ncbi:hypothetical protein H072_4029 [Dactylellina haptotyla CBS 200.50]|uniref:Alginate lyase domain-containing protein n=1 Tax=Dactylellina haptotyla (strain CBS 200.50) TaxID=1284197 RepID=S8AGJ9_DACHA|nr:hypothetical protein H072_4029 [Dactylellina haptotyla CBS 200.50]
MKSRLCIRTSFPLRLLLLINAFTRAQLIDIEIPPMTSQTLPPLPDLFQLNQTQWATEDSKWFERDAISQAPDLIEALANVAYLANSIDDDTSSATFGWQNGGVYRSDTAYVNNVLNARLMEPLRTLSWAYTLNKPWNPYYHNAILGTRLVAVLEYWLKIQSSNGGYTEASNIGTAAAAPTTFSLQLLVDMMDELVQDNTLDTDLLNRLLTGVTKGAELCVTDQGFIDTGNRVSNQYVAIFYILWRLWQITGDTKWQTYYNNGLDAWLADAQPAPFWTENYGNEALGYSRITEWILDRLYAINGDARILESFRRYFDWCGLHVLPENDGLTFITDVVGNGRTSAPAQFGENGYYGHITKYLTTCHAWNIVYMMTEAERQQRINDWRANPIPPTGAHPGKSKAAHIYSNWPMYFEPDGLTSITPTQQQAAVADLPTAPGKPNFTRYFSQPTTIASYLFMRRDTCYVTIHFGGRSNATEAKELGIIWFPGFGTFLRGTQANIAYAYTTRVGTLSTFKEEIKDFAIPSSWAPTSDGSVQADDDLAFTTRFANVNVTKTYHINNEGFSVTTLPGAAATEQIPLYIASTDKLIIDGGVEQNVVPGIALNGQTFKIKRQTGSSFTTASLTFSRPINGTFSAGYQIAQGNIRPFSVTLVASQGLMYTFSLDA